MGEIAVKLLAEQMKHQEKAEVKRIVLKPRFLVRNSVYPITRVPSLVKSAA
jgi:DNA-binding LacI/PurR family transcriptional regulator